jgi:hypothetical protein
MIEDINYTRHTDGWIEIEGYVGSELKTVSVSFDELVKFCADEDMNEYISDVLTGATRRIDAYEYTEENITEIIDAYFKKQF